MKSILITGGTGLIGRKLVNVLNKKTQYNVFVLTRNKSLSEKNSKYIYWEPLNGILDLKKIDNLDVVIHLAGESIDGARWSRSYKKKILDSRVLSTRLLYSKINILDTKPKTIVTASAIGYYKRDTKRVQDERCKPDDNFLSNVVIKWEEESAKFKKLGIRTIILRLGIVLSKEGGILKKLSSIFRFGLGVPVGTGNQIMSWIHEDDIIEIIITALRNNNFSGIINAVAPEKITNKEFTKGLVKNLGVLSLPVFIRVPRIIIKILFGERAMLVLNGMNVSSKKIRKLNYNFKFPLFEKALESIYKK